MSPVPILWFCVQITDLGRYSDTLHLFWIISGYLFKSEKKPSLKEMILFAQNYDISLTSQHIKSSSDIPIERNHSLIEPTASANSKEKSSTHGLEQ